MTEVQEPNQIVESSVFLAGNWLKTFVFFLITMALAAGTFVLESRFDADKVVTQAAFSSLNYKADNFIPDNGILRFADNSAMKIKSSKDKNYVFELTSGKVWADFSISNANSNFLVGKIVLIPDQAVFDANYDGSKLELNVYDGDVYVGFLADASNIEAYVDPYSSLFINRLLVSRENQLVVPMSKVNEEIRPLLYSKLVKEFKFAAFSDEVKNSDWLKTNMDKDKKAFALIRQKFDADVIDLGTRVKEGLLNNFIFWSEENLTYVPEKKEKIYLDHLFSFLDDAIYYASQGLKDQSDASLLSFDNYILTLSSEILHSKHYERRFEDYVQRLKIFGPGDMEYKISKSLLDRKFSDNKDKFKIVRSFWQDIYKSLNNNEALVDTAIDDYNKYFKKTRVENVKGELDENFYRNYLAYQNQLFDNLLMKYPLFYKKDGYFAIKTIFENDLLDLFPAGQLKDELKQAFVNNKINFMKRLKRFFFDGSLDVSQSKEIYKRLFSEISDLIPKDNSGLAVVKLFESQLADMNDFWGYLNSPEYQSSSYGSTHEERYKIYLQERKTIWSFVNIQQDVLGKGPVVGGTKSVTEVAQEVQKALQMNKDVNNVELGKIERADLRFVPVKFVLGGYPVEATYDRDNDAVKEVKVFNEQISDHAVKLEGLLNILQQKFADLSSKQPENDAKETIERAAQRTARNYIAEKIAKIGFAVKAENVKVVDELNAVYRVENVVYKDKVDTLVTFDVLMSGEVITNVFITVKGQPQPLSGKYSFVEFANLMSAEDDVKYGKVEKSKDDTKDNLPPADSTDSLPIKGVAR